MSRRKGRFIQIGLGSCQEYEGLTLHQILVWEYLQFRMEDGYLKGKQQAMAADLHMDKSTFARASQRLVDLGKLASINRKKDHMVYQLSDAQEFANAVSQEEGFADTANTDTANAVSCQDNKNKHLQEEGFTDTANADTANPSHETANAVSLQYIEVQEPSKNPSPTPSAAEEGKEKESIYFPFKDAPPQEIRDQLGKNGAGLAWHGGKQYWWGDWTKERQALHDQYRPLFRSFDHATGTEPNGAPVDKSFPPIVPSLPETDPQLRPVFDTLRAQVRADRYALWIAPLTATIEDDQVTLWAHNQLILDQVGQRYRAQLEAATTDLFSENTSLQICLFNPEEPIHVL